jgi:ADP-ribosylglycohydrolase/fructose-1,6-bisphosphatase/inositol monophosphatase family enzyme
MADLSAALEAAIDAARVARELLLKECALATGHRGQIGKCPADDEAEVLIRARLLEQFPTWGFLGEETGGQAAAPGEHHVWIVDPNDGTSSMQRGWRGHAVAIGLVRDGVPVLGVVHAVDAPDDHGDLITWAEGCGPICRNGHPLDAPTWPATLSSDDVVCLSIGSSRSPLGNLACVAPARFVGVPSIAYRLALVAAGEYCATVSLNSVSAWDIAAGHALVRGAGGVLVDEQGREIHYDARGHSTSQWVLGGGRAVVDELLVRPWPTASGSGFGDAAPPEGLAPVRPRPDRVVHDTGALRRAQGCMLGQLAGDALGALAEFQSPSSSAQAHPEGGPRELREGGPHRIMAGQPTDDSELALLLARTLVAREGFDQEAVARAYAGWYHGWTHAEEPNACAHDWCQPFDVGNTTRQALGAISAEDAEAGRAAERATAAADTESQANGALMRVSPLGIWGAFRSPEEVAEAARQEARLTHPNQVCQDASAVFAVTLAAAIREGLSPADTHEHARDFAYSIAAEPTVMVALAAARHEPPRDFMRQQGWVLVALQNAFYRLLHASNMEEAVVETVRSGGDTDTNAAICGALLGAVHGRDAVPAQWRRMVLSCRPMPGHPGVKQPRPAMYWPTDALIVAERLLASGAAAG